MESKANSIEESLSSIPSIKQSQTVSILESKSLSTQEWNQLFTAMNGFIHTQALAAGSTLGLFRFLSEYPGSTQAEIAAGLKLGEYATRVLMLAVCTTGMVEIDPATLTYRNHRIAEHALVPGKPQSVAPVLEFFYQFKERCGMHLVDSLRAERNVGLDREFPGQGETLYQRLADYPEMQQLLQDAVAMYSRLSLSMADVSEFANVSHLLDVGGGIGTNAILLCRKFPNLRVTVIDLPQVAEIGRRNVESEGLSDRITYAPLDFFKNDWPNGPDGVLMSNLAEIFSPALVRQLYTKAFDLLTPGGLLFVWANAANELESGGPEASRLSMYFLTTAGGNGMTYSARWHESLMREVGFDSVSFRYFVAITEHAAIVAKR